VLNPVEERLIERFLADVGEPVLSSRTSLEDAAEYAAEVVGNVGRPGMGSSDIP
jgi:hypothetical protein